MMFSVYSYVPEVDEDYGDDGKEADRDGSGGGGDGNCRKSFFVVPALLLFNCLGNMDLIVPRMRKSLFGFLGDMFFINDEFFHCSVFPLLVFQLRF